MKVKGADSKMEKYCWEEDPVENLKEEMRVALGDEPGDLLIKNIKIVDVYCEQIIHGSLLIKNGKIASINPSEKCSAKVIFDGKGLIACPGFIEPHCHIDTTLVTPDVLARGVVPAGTTTICAEILDFTHHEFNIGGEEAAIDAVKQYLKGHDKLPYRLLPVAPGKMVPLSLTAELLKWDGVFALGEILPGDILNFDDGYLTTLAQARSLHKWINGHIIGFTWVQVDDKYVPKLITDDEINIFSIAGYTSDHEPKCYEDVFRLLQHGVKPLARGMGGIFKSIISGMLNNNIPFDNLLFCYDDVTFDTLINWGHINWMVSESIKLGLDPIKAIKIATLNNAREIGMEHKLGSLTPGKYADLILFDQFSELKPVYVFKAGELVAYNGRLTTEVRIDYAALKRSMPEYYDDLQVDDIKFIAKKDQLSRDGVTAQIRLMDIDAFHVDETSMPVQDGEVKPELGNDILKLILANRDEARQMIKVFVKGYNLKDGALAISFTQKTPRIIAVGVSDDDIYEAIKTIDRYTGAVTVVRNGTPIDVLPLEISGMMSSLPADEVMARLNHMVQALKEMGCELPDPFYRLWSCGFVFRFE